MGHKINPKVLRIGITTDWRSRWFSGKNYAEFLKKDVELRRSIMKNWRDSAIADVEVERNLKSIRVVVKTSRPGVLVGRKGEGVNNIISFIKKNFFSNIKNVNIKVDIQDIKYFEENAVLVAQNISEQLEKRLPFRRVLKMMLDQVEKNKNVKGVKIQVSGRLNGAEMSRTEWLSRGTIPLHTLRADIDFSRDTARTVYGAIGVKVWIYKGEVFDN